MALVYINNVFEDVSMGLWRMDEEPEQLLSAYPSLRLLDMPYKNAGRQREFLCVRALLAEMTGDTALRIGHEENGRPVVCTGQQIPDDSWHISVSHTRGYAVLMLSRTRDVGVDIEYRSDRIVRIASHFIRPDEPAVTVEQMLTLWCAKETLYKLHSGDNLHYFDMRQASPADGDTLTIENMKRGETVTVYVTLTPEYCLTWAV